MDDLELLEAIRAKARELDTLISDSAKVCESDKLNELLIEPGGARDYLSDLLDDLGYARELVTEEMERHGTLPADLADATRNDWIHDHAMRVTI